MLKKLHIGFIFLYALLVCSSYNAQRVHSFKTHLAFQKHLSVKNDRHDLTVIHQKKKHHDSSKPIRAKAWGDDLDLELPGLVIIPQAPFTGINSFLPFYYKSFSSVPDLIANALRGPPASC
jgi:hypothetical protein